MPSAGLEFAVSITTTTGCAWSATTNAPFIASMGATSGDGSGSVRFAVLANSGEARQGSVQVAGRAIGISQAAGGPDACEYAVTPTVSTVASAGADVSIEVTLTSGTTCSWTATGNDAFITVARGGSGSGNGTVVLAVAANNGAARVGTAAVAGKVVTIAQDSPVAPPIPCAFSVSPTQVNVPAAGGTSTLTITKTQGLLCPWFVGPQPNFVTLAGSGTGVNDGAVQFFSAANPGPARGGIMQVAGVPVSVLQAAASGSTPGLATAILTLQSDPGDPIGGGQTSTTVFTVPEFQASVFQNALNFATFPSNRQWMRIELQPSGSSPLVPGTYNNIALWPVQSGFQPGLNIYASGRVCARATGRFLVSQAAYTGGSPIQGATVDKFLVRFEQHCEGLSAALRGQLWIDAQGSVTAPTAPSFGPAPSTPTTSLRFTPAGGSMQNLSIPGTVFSAWKLDPSTACITAAPAAGGTGWQIVLSAPNGQSLSAGTYDNATNAGGAAPGLVFSGPGAGCSSSTGRFVVLEAMVGSQGELLRFHATFEETCTGTSVATIGEIRIAADPWR